MPRPATPLPSAEEFYARLDRPPWQALSSVELAKLLGCPLNFVWNVTMRGTGPEPEPGDTHVRASNRRFFLPCLVLAWLSAKEGRPVPAWAWSRRWLAEHRLLGADADPAQVLTVIRHLAQSRIWRPKWKVRRMKYLARLEAVHAADPAGAGEAAPSRDTEGARIANTGC
jgi:hypothetical protein